MDVLLPHEDVGLCKDVAFSDSRIVAIYAAPPKKKGRPSENNSRIYGIDIRPLRGQIESPEGASPNSRGRGGRRTTNLRKAQRRKERPQRGRPSEKQQP